MSLLLRNDGVINKQDDDLSFSTQQQPQQSLLSVNNPGIPQKYLSEVNKQGRDQLETIQEVPNSSMYSNQQQEIQISKNLAKQRSHFKPQPTLHNNDSSYHYERGFTENYQSQISENRVDTCLVHIEYMPHLLDEDDDQVMENPLVYNKGRQKIRFMNTHDEKGEHYDGRRAQLFENEYQELEGDISQDLQDLKEPLELIETPHAREKQLQSSKGGTTVIINHASRHRPQSNSNEDGESNIQAPFEVTPRNMEPRHMFVRNDLLNHSHDFIRSQQSSGRRLANKLNNVMMLNGQPQKFADKPVFREYNAETIKIGHNLAMIPKAKESYLTQKVDKLDNIIEEEHDQEQDGIMAGRKNRKNEEDDGTPHLGLKMQMDTRMLDIQEFEDADSEDDNLGSYNFSSHKKIKTLKKDSSSNISGSQNDEVVVLQLKKTKYSQINLSRVQFDNDSNFSSELPQKHMDEYTNIKLPLARGDETSASRELSPPRVFDLLRVPIKSQSSANKEEIKFPEGDDLSQNGSIFSARNNETNRSNYKGDVDSSRMIFIQPLAQLKRANDSKNEEEEKIVFEKSRTPKFIKKDSFQENKNDEVYEQMFQDESEPKHGHNGNKNNRQYDSHSLFIFALDNPFRQKVINITESKVFEYGMIFFIVLNSLVLSFYDYSDRDSKTHGNKIIDSTNYFFTSIFIIEAFMKILAQGLFIHKYSYLRCGWNIIDTIVIFSGAIEMMMGSSNLKSLRVVRVFRPLKSINSIQGMKKLISALIKSIPEFGNVAIFLVFVLVLFATIGLHQYNGVFYNACRLSETPETDGSWETDISFNRVCTTSGLGYFECPNGMICGNPEMFPGITLESEQMYQRGYVNFGLTSFDNLGASILTVFQIVTSDTWYQQICNLMDADIPVLGALYVITMIVVGQFFMMNLILAVIIYAFVKSQKEDLQKELQAYNREENEKLKQTMRLQTIALNEEKERDMPEINVELVKEKELFRQEFNESKQSDHLVVKKVNNQKNNISRSVSQKKIKFGNEGKQKVYQNSVADSPSNNVGTFLKSQAKKRKVANMLLGINKPGQPNDNQDDHHLSQDQQPVGDFGSFGVPLRKEKLAIPQSSNEKLNLGTIFEPEIIPIEQSPKPILSMFGNLLKRTSSKASNSETPKSVKSGEHADQKITHPTSKLMMKMFMKNNQTDSQENNDSVSKRKTIQDNQKIAENRNPFKIIFKQFIEKKIDEERQKFFKNILLEATDVKPNQKSNMREIVGIKVGLQYMRDQQGDKLKIEQRRHKVQLRYQNNILYYKANILMESSFFSWFIAVAIILNTVILSLDKYPIDLERIQVLEKLNFIFTAIFFLELVIKILALGVIAFFQGAWLNILDVIVVLGSIIDIFVQYLVLVQDASSVDNSKGTGTIVTALRGFRLLRVFKLARNWKRFELLLETLGRTLKDIAVFSILLALFMFIFTLLGLELFAHKVKLNMDTNEVDMENGESPTFNFDTFLNSFSLVFILLTNDGTSAIYYNHYRAVGAALSTMYFVMLVIIGQKIILSLFVAILLENFDEGALKQKMHEYEENQREALDKKSKKKPNCYERILERLKVQWQKIKDKCKKKKDPSENFSPIKRGFTKGSGMSESPMKSLESPMKNSAFEHPEDHTIKLKGKALFIFSEVNQFRQIIFKMVLNKKFEQVTVLFIIASAVQIAMDTPLVDPNSNKMFILDTIDKIVNSIFTIEAIMKIIALGFYFNGKNSYLRQHWNKIDFFVVLISIFSYSNVSDNFKAFKVFRILRIISRSEGLKVGVKALINAMPNIANVTIIMFLFFLIFGVICVSQLKGKFYFCIEDHQDLFLTSGQTYELRSKWDCLNEGGIWVNQIYNFDDIPQAIVSLYVMATTAGWQDVQINSSISTEIDYIYGDYRSPFWILYLIVFMIVGNFFFLQLFMGVVVTTFNSEQERLGGNDMLTEKQREWIDLKLLILRAAPIKRIKQPQNKIRLILFKIQSHNQFENFITASICINTLILTIKWYMMPAYIEKVFEMINYFFTAIFLVEAIIKIIAQGFKVYISDSWNRFDLLSAVGSCLSIVISLNSSLELKGATTLIRSFRVLRILRLLKRRSLHMIFNTFVITIHSLANIGSLLLLIIYMYAVLGIILFGNIKRNGIMNEYMNFENFFNAFIVLFTVATGDSWNAIQTSFVVYESPEKECKWYPTYQDYIEAGTTIACGGKFMAYSFFTSYTFMVNLIFLQLFIAVILQGYEDTQVQEARLFNNDMSTQFREIWADFDPDATTFIEMRHIRDFLLKLGNPLGFDKSLHGQKFLQDKFIASLELPTYYDFSKYQFLDVLDALSFRLMVYDHFMKSTCADLGPPGNSKQSDNDLEKLQKMDSNQEIELKEELSKEINRLIFQRESGNITALQDMINKEMKKVDKKGKSKDGEGLTSSHHMAAEATVRRMRNFILQRRFMRENEQFVMNEDQHPMRQKSAYFLNRIGSNMFAADPTLLRKATNKLSIQAQKPRRIPQPVKQNNESAEDSDFFNCTPRTNNGLKKNQYSTIKSNFQFLDSPMAQTPDNRQKSDRNQPIFSAFRKKQTIQQFNEKESSSADPLEVKVEFLE